VSSFVQKYCNSERTFITKYGRHNNKPKAAEPPTAVCLKQHKMPQYADIQCCVLKGERNRAMGDTERERNIVCFEGLDNEYVAFNEIKEI
jgi:hypothetical protein